MSKSKLVRFAPKREQFLTKIYRSANWFHRHNLRFIARLFEVFIRVVYSATIPAAAQIGKNVHFGHNGLATIINASCHIGDNCMIGSHVILGGNTWEIGAPTIDDFVVIHAGSMVLGPITVGRGSVVAAQSFVDRDVPSCVLVMGRPARIVKEDINLGDYAMH